jgi:hypothetical protein
MRVRGCSLAKPWTWRGPAVARDTLAALNRHAVSHRGVGCSLVCRRGDQHFHIDSFSIDSSAGCIDEDAHTSGSGADRGPRWSPPVSTPVPDDTSEVEISLGGGVADGDERLAGIGCLVTGLRTRRRRWSTG